MTNKELLIKCQLNPMVNHIVNTYKYDYPTAVKIAVGSKTYHRLLSSNLYVNQSPLYVLEDFKKEISSQRRRSKKQKSL